MAHIGDFLQQTTKRDLFSVHRQQLAVFRFRTDHPATVLLLQLAENLEIVCSAVSHVNVLGVPIRFADVLNGTPPNLRFPVAFETLSSVLLLRDLLLRTELNGLSGNSEDGPRTGINHHRVVQQEPLSRTVSFRTDSGDPAILSEINFRGVTDHKRLFAGQLPSVLPVPGSHLCKGHLGTIEQSLRCFQIAPCFHMIGQAGGRVFCHAFGHTDQPFGSRLISEFTHFASPRFRIVERHAMHLHAHCNAPQSALLVTRRSRTHPPERNVKSNA